MILPKISFKSAWIPWLWLAFLLVFYIPLLNSGFFQIDDDYLVNVPYLRHFNLKALQSLFTFGNQADYYPVRDLSYQFDWLWGRDLEIDGTFARLQNLALHWLTGLLFFKILREYISLEKAFWSVSIWLFSAYHHESIVWLSARKDLLGLFWIVFSAYFYLQGQKHLKIKFFVFSFVCFFLSIFSKATFLLVPFALIAHFLISKPKFDKKGQLTFFTLSSMCLIATICFALQKFQYESINDMFYAYTLDYRVGSSLAALGRMFLGLFYSDLNTVDVENWGDWLSFNHQFIYVGILFLISTILLFMYGLRKKKKLIVILLLIAAAIYATTPGPNFLHRNFYSVRYFEAIFILAITLIAIYLPFNRKIWILIFAFSFFNFVTDLPNWESGLTILKKSYQQSPQNPSVKQKLMSEYLNMQASGRLNPTLEAAARNLWQELLQDCRPDQEYEMRNGHLCLNFWSMFVYTKLRIHNLGFDFPWQNAQIQLLFSEAQRQVRPQHAKLLSETLEGKMTSARQELINRYQNEIYFPKEDIRIKRIFYLCFIGKAQEAKELHTHYLEYYLISQQGFNDEYSQMPLKERLSIQNCLH